MYNLCFFENSINTLEQCSSKCGPWTKSIRITREIAENVNYQAEPYTY